MDFLIASVLVAALMVIYHVPVSVHVLWLPWLIGLELAFLLGMGLLAGALNVFFRDIKYIVPLCVQLGLFVTPVIYSTSEVPSSLRGWYMLNPMAVVIDGVRRVVLHGESPELATLMLSTAVVSLFVVLAYGYFKRVEVKFADLI